MTTGPWLGIISARPGERELGVGLDCANWFANVFMTILHWAEFLSRLHDPRILIDHMRQDDVLTSAHDGGDEDVVHDALGEAQAEVAVVDGAGHALGSVHLVKGHLWVLVEPEKRKTLVRRQLGLVTCLGGIGCRLTEVVTI